MKLRAISPLLIESDLDGIHASSPKLAHRIQISKSVAEFLLAASEGVEVRSDHPNFSPAISHLVKYGYLTEGEPKDRPEPWNHWGTLAWSFHERARDAIFIRRGSAEEAVWQEAIRHDPPPSPTSLQWKARHGEALLLPRTRANPDVSFWQILENRRTHRRFRDVPVRIDPFATLLHYTLAPLRFADAQELGIAELRANVSGGSRHETLGCVAVFNVSDIPQGLYVYDGIRHGLVLLRDDVGRETLEELTGAQGFCSCVGFSIITVADATKMSWKYRNPRAYRHLMNNVGAFAQVFSMSAYALGLGAAITGAIADSAFDKLLGLDSPREFATFFLSCGTPIIKADGMPVDFRAPRAPFEI